MRPTTSASATQADALNQRWLFGTQRRFDTVQKFGSYRGTADIPPAWAPGPSGTNDPNWSPGFDDGVAKGAPVDRSAIRTNHGGQTRCNSIISDHMSSIGSR